MIFQRSVGVGLNILTLVDFCVLIRIMARNRPFPEQRRKSPLPVPATPGDGNLFIEIVAWKPSNLGQFLK